MHLCEFTCNTIYTRDLYFQIAIGCCSRFRPRCSLIQRRDTSRLIYDILCLARERASKYRVTSKANLNFRQTERYTSFLLDNGHLQIDSDGDSVKHYMLTLKGQRLLQSLEGIQQELKGLFAKGSGNLGSATLT